MLTFFVSLLFLVALLVASLPALYNLSFLAYQLCAGQFSINHEMIMGQLMQLT
jgi:hypothetical protein